MATQAQLASTPYTINQLLGKLNDADPDFRFMSLSDLIAVLENSKPDMLKHDYNTAARTVDGVVKALDDQNGEVQNQAKKCLAPLVRRIPTTLYAPLMEKLSGLKIDHSSDVTVPAVAIRTVIEALPRPIPGVVVTKEAGEAYQSISKVLIPRLLGRNPQGQKTSHVRLPPFGKGIMDKSADLTSDTVDVLVELVKYYGTMLQSVEVEALNDSVYSLINDDKASAAVRKKAVVALAILAIYLSDDALASFVSRSVEALENPKLSSMSRRLYLTLFGSIARSIPYRFGQYIVSVAPLLLASLGEEDLQQHLEEVSNGNDSSPDFGEIREATLSSLEAFLASCPAQMRPLTQDVIEVSLRYLKYDPNYSLDDDDDEMGQDEEEEEEDDNDDDNDFEEDDEFDTGEAFDDDDDASWKVRRCAAKTLTTLITTRSNGDLLDDGTLYHSVAPTLIQRFGEREENVRLEIIAAMDLLIQKTGDGVVHAFSNDAGVAAQAPSEPSRKRRRQDSVVGPLSQQLDGTGLVSPTTEKIPTTGPRAELAKMTPAIVKAATKQLKATTLPTKQAMMSLLDDFALVQQGGLAAHLDQIIALIIDSLRAPASGATSATATAAARGAASATPATVRIVALRLLGHIAKTHSSSLLQTSLSKLVDVVTTTIHDRFYKASSEAITTAGEIIKAITPPRSNSTAHEYKADLVKLYDALIDRINAADADAEVRQNAITVLGVLLARIMSGEGSDLLPVEKRRQALKILLDRLRNETTRVAAVAAVDAIALASYSSATTTTTTFDQSWFSASVLELSEQLRKSNRTLRSTSVQALKHLILSPASKNLLDAQTTSSIVTATQNVLAQSDAPLLVPTLQILNRLASEHAHLVVSDALTTALGDIVKTNVVSTAIHPLIELVSTIGAAGEGQKLMQHLLQNVGVNGDPAILGRVIGALLVASGSSAGVTLDSFIEEAKTNAQDTTRASLALSVLGEAGLRLGEESPLKPQIFLDSMGTEFDKVALTAAQALGRAGAGNPKLFVPVILKDAKQTGPRQYLLLQAIKELLQHDTDISTFSEALWDALITAAAAEDNRAVCAESMGRLAIIDPNKYIPKLDALLKSKTSAIRGVSVQALRFSLPDSDDAFDSVLRNHLVGMLSTVLQDSDMETRRLGMTAFNSAAHNKPDLLLPYLSQLVPFVMSESVIKPEFIREVQMGPFKHIVDDGLEVRKSAYETLYAMIDIALSRISISQLFDRVVAGIKDDYDIRSLSNLMITKLVVLDPEETSRRLDSIAEAYRATLSTKLKSNAVKQETERQDDANKSVLRVTLLLGDKLRGATALAGATSSVGSTAAAVGGGGGGGHGSTAAAPSSSTTTLTTTTMNSSTSQVWLKYWDWVNHDFKAQLGQLRQESDGVGQQHGG